MGNISTCQKLLFIWKSGFLWNGVDCTKKSIIFCDILKILSLIPQLKEYYITSYNKNNNVWIFVLLSRNLKFQRAGKKLQHLKYQKHWPHRSSKVIAARIWSYRGALCLFLSILSLPYLKHMVPKNSIV